MTGNIGFSTTVVLATIIDRGSQSRSFSSRMSPGGSAARAGARARSVRVAASVRALIGGTPDRVKGGVGSGIVVEPAGGRSACPPELTHPSGPAVGYDPLTTAGKSDFSCPGPAAGRQIGGMAPAM